MKTIYTLELHESLYITEEGVHVTRVASGWLYKYYKEVYNEEQDTYDTEIVQIIFVPYDNRFE